MRLPPARPRRLAFLGSPALAVPPLRALHGAGHEVVLVVTNPDRRRGRGGGTTPTPVKAAAEELGIPVSHEVDDVIGSGADAGVVVAFGRLLRPHVLEAVPMLNLHFSLLPRWRGAAPVERSILAGDERTGVCLMALEEGLDTGPVYGCRELEVGPDEHLDELVARLVAAGSELLLASLAEGLGEPRAQEGEATYAAKLEPAELELRWDRPAEHLHRLVRLGRAWTTFRGQRLRVLRARPVGAELAPGALDGTVVGAGASGLELLEVQPQGRQPQPAAAWRNGARPVPGERLGS